MTLDEILETLNEYDEGGITRLDLISAFQKYYSSQNSGKPFVSGSLPLSEAQITELAHIGSNYVYEGVMEDGRISELGILEVIKKYEEFKRQ